MSAIFTKCPNGHMFMWPAYKNFFDPIDEKVHLELLPPHELIELPSSYELIIRPVCPECKVRL